MAKATPAGSNGTVIADAGSLGNLARAGQHQLRLMCGIARAVDRATGFVTEEL